MFNSLSINPNIKKESSWVPRIYLLDPSSQKTLPGGQQEQGHWVVGTWATTQTGRQHGRLHGGNGPI